MNIELRHLRAFCSVAEDLNFRRASERIGIAQPALSRTIKQLETEMGVILFERTTRVTRLTDAGQDFLASANEILASIETAVQRARRVTRGVAGEIKVGFNDFAISGLLPETVRRFRVAFPDVEVKLVDVSTPDMLSMLLDGALDVAFHTAPAGHDDLDSIVVREERLVCVLPAHHRLSGKSCDSVDLGDLRDEDFVMGRWETWRIYHRLIRDYCRAYGFQPRIIQEAEHSDGIMGLVAAGMGVTLYVDSEWLHNTNGVAVKALRKTLPALDTLASWRRDQRGKKLTIDNLLKVTSEVVENYGLKVDTPLS